MERTFSIRLARGMWLTISQPFDSTTPCTDSIVWPLILVMAESSSGKA